MRYQAPSKIVLAATAVLALSTSLTLALSNPIEVRVNGQPLISDVPPVASPKDGVFVPLRPVSEALGADARYEHKSGEVIVTRGDQVLHVKVGSTTAKLNGMPLTMRHAPFRVRGRVMVSLGAVERAFSVRVRFDKATARVEVEEPGVPANAPPLETQ